MANQSHPEPHRYGSSLPGRSSGAGWWRRLFAAPEPVVTPPPVIPREPVHLRRDAPGPLVVPARGDAFDFQVHPSYTWTARRMTQEELRYRVDGYLTWAGWVVRDQVVDIAREYAPHQSHEMEHALNVHLAGRQWPDRGETPRFSVRVRVSPDDRVRERLQPYWQERIKLECEHELAKLRTQYARELTRQWREVLVSLDDDPVTSHAARLTGDRFAEVFARYVDERRAADPELVEHLRSALRGHGDLGMGPSEYTEAWDVALRSYERQQGLSPVEEALT